MFSEWHYRRLEKRNKKLSRIVALELGIILAAFGYILLIWLNR